MTVSSKLGPRSGERRGTFARGGLPRVPARSMLVLASMLLLLGCPGRPAQDWDGRLELDLRAHHPNGTVLRVTWLELAPDHVAAEVSVVNGSGFPVRLNAAGDLVLLDDLGNRHRLAAPTPDPDLTVPAQRTLDGRLVFLGGLHPEARKVTLVTNERRGSETWAETPAPRIAIDIPLPAPAGTARLEPAPETETTPREPSRVTRLSLEPGPYSLIEVREVEAGIQVTVQSELLFDFDSSELAPEATAALEEVAEVLRQHPRARLEIHGHTDSVGPADYNQRLSEHRAETVRSYLVERLGVETERLTALGFGATRPVAPNVHPDGSDNPEGRRLNRRVEVLILADGGEGP